MAKNTKPLRCPYCGSPMQNIRFSDHDGHRVCRECRGASPAVRLARGSDTPEAARQIDAVVAPILNRIERDRAIAAAAIELVAAKDAHRKLFEDQIEHEHDGWIEARSNTRRRVNDAECVFWKLVDTAAEEDNDG